MSFRRIPFQFSTTDPAERQRELEKRFGVPAQNKMHVDAANPLMGSGFNTSTSSPRFQHRVPIFSDGMPAQSSVDSSTCENKTPKVRIIPIEIEQDESVSSTRHRTFSGPAEISKKHSRESCPPKDDASTLKRSMEDLSKPSKMKTASGPKVYNIPIKVEQSEARDEKAKSEKGKIPAAKSDPIVNGCNVSKRAKNVDSKPSPQVTEATDKAKNIDESLKKIDIVQEELKSYETGVNDFKGTAKDKQYRYLDEMLTRCMIKLDDVETMGNEEVRSARKKVVKMVQSCIDLLESKVNIVNSSDTSVNTNHEPKLQTIEKKDDSKPSQNKSSIADSSSSEFNHDVPEIEMAEVTSTSSDMNKCEKMNIIDDPVTDQLQSDATNTMSDEITTQSSECNEIEMTEFKTNMDSQIQKETKPEVSSTNILNPENGFQSPVPSKDVNEAEMNESLQDNKKVETIPEVSSTVVQPDASNIKQFSAETISENDKTVESVEPEEVHNCSSSDTNFQTSIPEVEMKEIIENS